MASIHLGWHFSFSCLMLCVFVCFFKYVLFYHIHIFFIYRKSLKTTLPIVKNELIFDSWKKLIQKFLKGIYGVLFFLYLYWTGNFILIENIHGKKDRKFIFHIVLQTAFRGYKKYNYDNKTVFKPWDANCIFLHS